MGLFNLFKRDNNSIKWKKIRLTNEVYPPSSICILMTQSESGKLATGWVDLGYIDYQYKKFCPINLQFNIWIDESTHENLDMETIENYFTNVLKDKCVTHCVARIATDFGMVMDFYIDKPEFAQKVLNELHESENKLVEFGCEFNHDVTWKEYFNITKLLE